MEGDEVSCYGLESGDEIISVDAGNIDLVCFLITR